MGKDNGGAPSTIPELEDEKDEKEEREAEPLQGAQVAWIVVIALALPRVNMVAYLGLGVVCMILTIQFVDLSDPLAGLRLRRDQSALESDAWIISVENASLFWDREQGQNSDVQEPQQSRTMDCLRMFYVAGEADSGANVFTPERLGRIERIERDIVSLPGFSDYCKVSGDSGFCRPFRTVMSVLAFNTSADLVSQATIDARLTELWATDRGTMKRFLTHEFNGVDALASHMTRSDMCFGMPLAGFKNKADRKKEQENVANKWISSRGGLEELLDGEWDDKAYALDVIFSHDYLDAKTANEILLQDTFKCVLAVSFVLLVLTVHMRSFFLSSMAVVQVLLSFPVAFFFYRIIMGIELFGGLQLIAGTSPSFFSFFPICFLVTRTNVDLQLAPCCKLQKIAISGTHHSKSCQSIQ